MVEVYCCLTKGHVIIILFFLAFMILHLLWLYTKGDLNVPSASLHLYCISVCSDNSNSISSGHNNLMNITFLRPLSSSKFLSPAFFCFHIIFNYLLLHDGLETECEVHCLCPVYVFIIILTEF